MTTPRRLRRRRPATIGRWVRARILVAGGVITMLFAGIGYRAYGVQVARSDHYRQLARRQHVATVEVPAPRGVIYDAAGVELAVTADIQSVYANPRRVGDPEETARALAEVVDIDVARIADRLDSDRYFAWVERHVTPEVAARVSALEIPGVALTAEPRRFYPAESVAGPVLGFSNIDGKGLDGIERSMDDLLMGRRAELAALRDARGEVMLPETPSGAEPGASITLTLDRYVQFAAHRALRAAVDQNDAAAGTAVVLDVDSGGVLAMANWPTYDPNAPSAGLAAHARNRAITDTYEPGSILKVFLVGAALEAGVVEPDTVIDVEDGRLRVGRAVFRDSFHDEELTVGGVIKRSSNVGAIKIARRLGARGYHEALERYRFGDATGIELPGERAGLLHPHEGWGDVELATMSFGYGMMATPLQLAAGLAAVGNGGVYRPPRIVERAVSSEGEVLYRRQPQGTRVLSERVTRQLLPMLASVFEKGRKGGTARKLEVNGYRAGGKTGTALKVNPETGTYYDDVYMSSFAGLAPIEDPRIAVVVMIDEPSGEHYYGAHVAGPAFAEIVARSLRYLGVPPDAEPAERPGGERPGGERPDGERPGGERPATAAPAHPVAGGSWRAPDGSERASAPDEPLPPDVVRVPDFTGLGLARALEVAGEAGIEVTVEGSGAAVWQRPAPGSRVGRPATCRIVFAPGEG